MHRAVTSLEVPRPVGWTRCQAIEVQDLAEDGDLDVRSAERGSGRRPRTTRLIVDGLEARSMTRRCTSSESRNNAIVSPSVNWFAQLPVLPPPVKCVAEQATD